MTEYNITITHVVTDEFLMDVLTTAVESGHDSMWYWEDFCILDVDRDVAEYHPVKACKFIATVNDKPERWGVTIDTVHKAIQDLLNGKGDVNDRILGYIRSAVKDHDAGDIDAEAADVIVQVAAFGEVVFG